MNREERAVVGLLEQDWESPEELAKAIIKTLDSTRASKIRYVGVLQFGKGAGTKFYAGLGPYPGAQSALNALRKHPAADEASGAVIIPIRSNEGFLELIKKLDERAGQQPPAARSRSAR